METGDKIFSAALIALITTFVLVGDLSLEPTHYCLEKEQRAYCFDIRDYGDKINYRCLYNESNTRTYKSCPDGWKEIGFIETVKYNSPSGNIHCTSSGCS